jgi:hypothetical protein
MRTRFIKTRMDVSPSAAADAFAWQLKMPPRVSWRRLPVCWPASVGESVRHWVGQPSWPYSAWKASIGVRNLTPRARAIRLFWCRVQEGKSVRKLQGPRRPLLSQRAHDPAGSRPTLAALNPPHQPAHWPAAAVARQATQSSQSRDPRSARRSAQHTPAPPCSHHSLTKRASLPCPAALQPSPWPPVFLASQS